MNTSLNEPEKGPVCGKPITVKGLGGLCPSCLLVEGAATEQSKTQPAQPFQAPPVEEIGRLFPQLEILGLLGGVTRRAVPGPDGGAEGASGGRSGGD